MSGFVAFSIQVGEYIYRCRWLDGIAVADCRDSVFAHKNSGLDGGGQRNIGGEFAEGASDGGGAFHVHVVAGVG